MMSLIFKFLNPLYTTSAFFNTSFDPIPTVYMFNLLAPSIPEIESSKTTQSLVLVFVRSAAILNPSGSGFALETLFPSIITVNRSMIFN